MDTREIRLNTPEAEERKVEEEGLLRRLKIAIHASPIKKSSLFVVLISLLVQRLAMDELKPWESVGTGSHEFPDVSATDRFAALLLFWDIDTLVRQFQDSDKEGKRVLAQLLVWCARKLAISYL